MLSPPLTGLMQLRHPFVVFSSLASFALGPIAGAHAAPDGDARSQNTRPSAEKLEEAVNNPPRRAAPSAQLLRDDHALSRWVLAHSPEVAAARSERAAARAVSRGARLFPNPVVDFTFGNVALGQTNPPGHPRDKTLLYEVGLSETIEIAKREPRGEAADLHLAAAENRMTATGADRIGEARLALAQLVYARARALELDASLTQARAAADVAKGRLDHQALAGVDYDRLLIDLVGIETEASHAHADAEAAAARCAATLLAPCDGSADDVAALEPAANVPKEWQPVTLRKRSDIRALELEGVASSREADLAGARAIPDVTFRVGYTHDTFTESGNLNNSLALSVSAPLPAFDRGQHDKTAALARATQYAQLAHGALARARGDVAALFTRKRSVENALARLTQDVLPRANSVLAAQERGLLEGQLDITDLLLARREAIALRLQTLDLHFELFTLRNELRQALGLDEAIAQR
ncbi:MAG: TolC family protein [Polyangiales bacterium]